MTFIKLTAMDGKPCVVHVQSIIVVDAPSANLDESEGVRAIMAKKLNSILYLRDAPNIAVCETVQQIWDILTAL
jgi:hypothetical protein